MPGSHSGRSHNVAAVVQHVDALPQFRVSHQHHVTHVRTGCTQGCFFFFFHKLQVRHLQFSFGEKLNKASGVL